jgi:2-(1,2-epoxy-1,2-dihydrophenyl)acetyl-CoA isomerase
VTAPHADIRVEDAGGGVTLITLDRPESFNAYTTGMCEQLATAVDAFARDDAQRVLVLTGAGRGFCSGGDVGSGGGAEEHKAATRQLGHAVVMREGMHAVVRALWALDKPTVAMVNGPAVAGGLTLALVCDLRIAADTAVLGDPSGTAGLLPDEGGAWLFPRAMGLDRALRMTLLGERYDAATARELGLVTEVVPAAELRERTLALATALAARAPLAVRLAKRMMRRGLELTLDQSLGDAELAVLVTNDSDDVREGVEAFRSKRPPVFRGR